MENLGLELFFVYSRGITIELLGRCLIKKFVEPDFRSSSICKDKFDMKTRQSFCCGVVIMYKVRCKHDNNTA